MDKIPELSYDLIQMLDKNTPEMCYDISLTKEENIYYAGQRALVNGLLLILENQKEEED